MWLGDIAARALITRPGVTRDKLGETFVEPAGDGGTVTAIEDEVGDLVAQGVAAKFIGRIAQEEEAALRLNATGPLLEVADLLEFHPVFRTIEEIYMTFAAAGGLDFVEFLDHYPVIELGLDCGAGSDKTPDVVIDEMLALGVFPIFRVQGKGRGAEPIIVLLTKRPQLDVLEAVQAVKLLELAKGRPATKEEETERKATIHPRSRSYIRARKLHDWREALRRFKREPPACQPSGTDGAVPAKEDTRENTSHWFQRRGHHLALRPSCRSRRVSQNRMADVQSVTIENRHHLFPGQVTDCLDSEPLLFLISTYQKYLFHLHSDSSPWELYDSSPWELYGQRRTGFPIGTKSARHSAEGSVRDNPGAGDR